MTPTILRSGYKLLRGKLLWLGTKLCCKAILPYYYHISGFLSEAEALTLYRLARKLPAGSTIVEIGSWQGRSTYCLARGLRNGIVHAIDPFDASGGGDHGAEEVYRRIVAEQDLNLRQTFLDNMRRAGVAPKIQIAHGVARDFVGTFPTIDLLFIDGDHSVEGCLFDFEQFAPCLRPGGYLLSTTTTPSVRSLV
jgi:predicted O-methyltransferase YrrM